MKEKKLVMLLVLVGFVSILIAVLFTYNSKHLGEKFSDMGNRHIEDTNTLHASYNSNPPTSGPHVEYTAPWGISDEIIPDEVQVHNLEDGGVVVQYNPSKVSKDDIKQLEQIVKSSSRRNILMAPRYDMDYNIALTAWRRLLTLESVDEERIDGFIHEYAGKDHHARF